jgi:vacuole morphology and inheritance protein 14
MNTLKVCFVLDCTASMSPWIYAAKNKILDVLEDLSSDHQNFKIYVAFIGYRDFEDDWIEVNFTDNHRHVHDVIMGLDAIGGDDVAEDVAGAYNKLNNLHWDASVRAVFHIGDAPAHGYVYHDERVSDNYPDGHPTIDLLHEVRNLAYKQVDLTLFRLTRSTDIMYRLMKTQYMEVYPEGFRFVDFVKSNQTPDDTFYHEVSSQLNCSMKTYDPTSSK